MYKSYIVTYRKRGLPHSENRKVEVMAETRAEAIEKLKQNIGEEYTIVGAELKKC